jgi:hypothetical protein
VDEIHGLYKEHVPAIMRQRTAAARSEALGHLPKTVFGAQDFAHVKTGVEIVATRWELERPMIFKGSVTQAHGRHATFIPGFGCTIADAIRASCSAYPFFEKTVIKTGNGKRVELIDGGYCANNPTLYAIADAGEGTRPGSHGDSRCQCRRRRVPGTKALDLAVETILPQCPAAPENAQCQHRLDGTIADYDVWR